MIIINKINLNTYLLNSCHFDGLLGISHIASEQ